MTDQSATWTEKFDSWWAQQGVGPDSPANLARRWLEAAYVAGAAAERIECVCRLKRREGWFPREDMGAANTDD